MNQDKEEPQSLENLCESLKDGRFIYRLPVVANSNISYPQSGSLSVKFAQRTCILDEWYLFGGTPWTRFLYRLKHPFVYGKRGLRNLYRRIKSLFVKDKRTLTYQERGKL